MNTTLFTRNGVGLGMLMRAEVIGHRCTLVRCDATPATYGNGLVTNVIDLPRPALLSLQHILDDTESDLAIITFSGLGKIVARLRKNGKKIFGGDNAFDSMSNQTWLNVFSQATGIPLVTDVNGGTIYHVEFWFNGHEPSLQHVCMENSEQLTGGMGIRNLPMGGMLAFTLPKSKMCEMSINKIVPVLNQLNYVGNICLRMVIDPKGKLSLLGVDGLFTWSFYALCELLKVNPLALMSECTSNVKLTEYKRVSEIACALRMVVPPFPYTIYKNQSVVKGVDIHNTPHVWLEEVEMIEGTLIASGGSLGWVTARGDNPNEARRRVYRTVGHLSAPEIGGRVDIGWVDRERWDLLLRGRWLY